MVAMSAQFTTVLPMRMPTRTAVATRLRQLPECFVDVWCNCC